MFPQASVCSSGGYRVTGSTHAWGQSPRRSPGTNSPQDCLCPGLLPRAGSLPRRFGSSRSGPAPLLRCAGHPASSAGSHGCIQRSSTATVAPGAVWWGAVWSEVKEEGRMGSREALESTTGPGDMNATRHRAAPLSRRTTTEDRCQRKTANGRECAFDLRRTRRSPCTSRMVWRMPFGRFQLSPSFASIFCCRRQPRADHSAWLTRLKSGSSA